MVYPASTEVKAALAAKRGSIRGLALRRCPSAASQPGAQQGTQFKVVVNWFEELNQPRRRSDCETDDHPRTRVHRKLQVTHSQSCSESTRSGHGFDRM